MISESWWLCARVVGLTLHVLLLVWHHNLTASQSDKLESLQKRTIRIMLAVEKSYEFLVSFSKIEPLFERKTTIGKTFFNKMCHESNCLINNLLPDKRRAYVTPDFREKNATPNMLSAYPVPFNRAKRYQSLFCALWPVPI